MGATSPRSQAVPPGTSSARGSLKADTETIKERVIFRERGSILFLVCILAILGVYVGLAGRFFSAWTFPVDWEVYLTAASGFLEGQNVYAWLPEDYAQRAAQLHLPRQEIPPYIYPPLTAMLAVPFLSLPAAWGAFLWALSNGIAYLTGVALLAARMNSVRGRVLLLLGGGVFYPVISTLRHGQVNGLIFLFSVLAVEAILHRQALWGGVALGSGLMLKPLAIGLVILYLLRRRWKILWGVVLSVVAVSILSAALFGPAGVGFLDPPRWMGRYLVNPSLPQAHPYHQNLPGFFSRHFPSGFLLLILGSGVLVAVSMLLCLPGRKRPPSELELALFIIIPFLIVPRTLYHHLLMLFLPIGLVLRTTSGKAYIVRAGLLCAYALIAIWDRAWAWHFLTFSPFLDSATWGSMLLWVVVAYALWRERGAVPART